MGKVSNISDARLRNQLDANQVVYDKLYLKKVQFNYNDGRSKKSFKGSFVIEKDSQIIVSIYALMGIELVRAKFTKNEVVILDKHNKVAMFTNYNFFSTKYGLDLDFFALQSILSNSLFLYPSDGDYMDGLKKYKHHVEDDFYSFKSLKDKRLGRLSRRSNNNIILHEIDIYPDLYRIFNVYIKDFSTNQSVFIKYKDFKSFDDILFPERLEIKAAHGSQVFDVDLKINFLEINDGGSLHFKIPSSYTSKAL
ncbi:DUF4292 domain-containing protein [Saccharicrinis fermentans]|uniref:DUF4292 domain-containing protein n=1 Tax=Saccharicrinis fermentans TaxID=982 RepID=UPI0004AC5DDA|nr:DUF4292 domain-containing protein [Saccharicrinis fermentans]